MERLASPERRMRICERAESVGMRAVGSSGTHRVSELDEGSDQNPDGVVREQRGGRDAEGDTCGPVVHGAEPACGSRDSN